MTPRIATLEDSEAVLALYRALVGPDPLGGALDVARVLEHPGTMIWVAPTETTLAAMATLHVLPNVTQGGRPYALIENVVTLPAMQGRGFGRLVMQAAIDAAWDQDAYKIMLMTGRETDAKGFYERLGFSSSEKWPMTLRRAPIRNSGI